MSPINLQSGASMQGKPSSDTLFIRKKCAEWLVRCLKSQEEMRESIIELLAWILGRPLVDIATCAQDWLSNRANTKAISPRTKGLLQEAASDLEDDNPEQLIEALNTVVQIGPVGLVEILAMKANAALTEYLSQNHYQGGSSIEQCMDQLGRLLCMSEHERDICLVLYCKDKFKYWERYFEDDMGATSAIGRDTLCSALSIDGCELRKILSGRLARLGILEVHNNLSISQDYIDFIEFGDMQSLKKELFTIQKVDALPLSDYPMGSAEVEHVCALLAAHMSTPTHILLYGLPGTGKSSFAHSLAKRLNLQVYSVANPEKSDPVTRRAGIEACLNITSNGSEGLVIVDEADNILNTFMSFIMIGKSQDKGWLNELLERPNVRMIWITNDIDSIEPSVRRRFAYSILFQPLGVKQRIRIWGNILKKNDVSNLLSPEQVTDLAQRYNLSAGYVDLAVKKAVESRGKRPARFLRSVELSLRAGLTLANDGRPAEHARAMDSDYSLEGINVSCDLDGLIARLERFDRCWRSNKALQANMNLLFYGPPGTGKTELAKYVAHWLKREMVTRRASELLSPYIGMTERHIAEAFRSAEKDEAVLLIDEADSFIFDRSLAVRSWEVTAVNEFLTQMERFRGVLICTTNRMEQLDSASMRRFTQKIDFDYLTGDGNVIFYRRMLAPLVHGTSTRGVLDPLCRCSNLAPGDFKIVRDRFSFYSRKEITHEILVQALLEESQIKVGRNRTNPIGFTHQLRK